MRGEEQFLLDLLVVAGSGSGGNEVGKGVRMMRIARVDDDDDEVDDL